jgi:hypothetical protein
LHLRHSSTELWLSAQVAPKVPYSMSETATLGCVHHRWVADHGTNTIVVIIGNLAVLVELKSNILYYVGWWQGWLELLKCPNHSDQLEQQRGSLTLQACCLASQRHVLAWPTSHHQPGVASLLSPALHQVLSCELSA